MATSGKPLKKGNYDGKKGGYKRFGYEQFKNV